MSKLFEVGKQFPDEMSIERLAKYIRGRSYFDGKQPELIERATDVLKDTPHAPKLKKLYIGVNIIDALTTKPADMMFGEPPSYLSGKDDSSPEQEAIDRIVEKNGLNKLGWEVIVGAGIRGDSWLKVYFDYRQDFSALEELGLDKPEDAKPEVIIESVPGHFVFPEVSKGNKKKFRAINIAHVTWAEEGIIAKKEVPFLNVERHVPGFIIYEKFKLTPAGVNSDYDAPIDTYRITERVATGRERDVIRTGIAKIPLFHIPYKTIDDTWSGISNIEKVESLLSAINDRLAQIDYILWKHSDPNAYGPPAGIDEIRSGGRYIPVEEGDVVPGYMEWNSQLEAAFKELDRLIGMVFAVTETPQWIFGSTITEMDSGGTGTSHTDGAAIKARFQPILSKVKRIRVHADEAIRGALHTAMEMEQVVREWFDTDVPEYEPVYPNIVWKDGLPRNDKEEAEIMALRTGNKQTIDTLTAIKILQNMDVKQAERIANAIKEEKKTAVEEMMIKPSVDLSGWNEEEVEDTRDEGEKEETEAKGVK